MTTAGNGHPSTDQLAEFAEGTADVTADIQSHATQCAECRDQIATFAAVKTALRAAPTAVPTPPDVSTRISAAVANAADRRAAETERESELAQGGPVAWFRRRMPRALAATASVAVIGLAGYVAVLSNPGGDDEGAAGTAANDAGDAEVAPEGAPGDLDAGGEALRDEAMATRALDALVIDIWDSRDEWVPGCGSGIAAETGGSLVGSAEIGANVLVVVEDASGETLKGWLVPVCSSAVAAAVDNVTVPVPAE